MSDEENKEQEASSEPVEAASPESAGEPSSEPSSDVEAPSEEASA